jgi:hypothetical protein
MDVRRIASVLGQRGGRARARRLSAVERRHIASLGGQARRRSREIAQRVADNFRYAAAVIELRGRPQEVTPLRTFDGRLPGIYEKP